MRISLLLPLLLGLSGCTRLFFAPTRAAHSDPLAAGLKCEAIRFSSGDGTPLTGLFFPAAGAPKATVVHFHGNGQNMTAHYHYPAWLAAEGYNVFVFDYRGYGASGGAPGLDGAVADGRAALRHALKLPGAQPGRLVVFGQSLGGAVAIAALAEEGLAPAALVVEGSFHSYRGMAAARLRSAALTWPFSWLPWLVVSGRHSPSGHIGRIAGPKVFIHSPSDDTVPFSQGRRLFEAAAEPKRFWEVPAGHIEAFTAFGSVFRPRLLSFLDEALGRPAP